MRLIFLIAFRNLFRQKGRSILIGLGVFVAVIYMMLSGALTKGIYSNVIEKVVESNIIGHVTVNIFEKEDSKTRSIIRERDKIISIIKDKMSNVKDVKEIVDTNVFAVGNGEGGMLALNGAHAPSISDLVVISGNLEPFSDGSVENPLILEKPRAKALKVKAGDVVKVRLTTIYGQVQTAQLNLVAVVEYRNPFMTAYFPAVVPLDELKSLLGYEKSETQRLNIALKKINKSDEMVAYADQLHSIMQSEISSLNNPVKLAERSYSQADYQKKLRDIRKSSSNDSIMNITSLQEYDEETFSGEKTSEIVGFIAMLIVISIILVGILNTMRMTVRERTNEIGTVRAIGMQRKTVIKTLLTEVFLLSIFCTVLGIFAAMGLMELISMVQFHPSDLNFSMILNDGHLVFKIPVSTTVFNLILILTLFILSAWLPARKAAKKTVAEALGHFE